MDALLQDLRYGIRSLGKSPTFTVLTIATLALAIGVNTAIFSMVNVLMFQPLPIGDRERAGFIYSSNVAQGTERDYATPADFVDFRRELSSFTEIGGVVRDSGVVLSGTDEPLRANAWRVTANVFDIWKVEPFRGRNFLAGEDEPGAERVAILSHGFWERRFGGDPDVVGRTVEIDGYDTTIVGVADPVLEFGSLARADLWLPYRIDPATASREQDVVWTTARLREGVSLEHAHQEVAAMGRRLAERHPETNGSRRYRVLTVNEVLAPEETWTIFYLLILTVGFVLLIACSNVATMMLTRATARARELAVRVALGAGRVRIVRQLLTESLLLSVGGGILGLGVTKASLEGLVWLVGENVGTNFFSLLEIDGNVLLFTVLVALLAPLLFGFLPALRASRPDLAETLKDSSRGASSLSASKGRRALVVTQVALALSLMVVAGLLIRTMIEMRTVDHGFPIEGVLTARIDLPEASYPDGAERLALFDAVRERVGSLPGVEGAAWSSARPFLGGMPNRTFRIEGEPLPDPERAPWANELVVSPGYTDVIRLPLRRGRTLRRSDNVDAPPVAMVNRELVRRYLDDGNPVGRRVRLGGPESAAPWIEIVGVLGDMHMGDPEEPAEPILYRPLEQRPSEGMALLLRTGGDSRTLAAAVRREVWAVDPDLPVADVRTLERLFADAFAVMDAFFSMFFAFAVFALVMAAMGIYGVVSFLVARRAREFGIRMALGASGREVLRMVARQSLTLVGVGVAVGAIGAALLSRVLASAIPGMSAGDPVALAGVAATLALAALLATWIPARRAVRVDPVTALRQE